MDLIKVNYKINTRGTTNIKINSPIVLEVYKNRKERKRISTGISIKPKDWDIKNESIKKSNPNYIELNSQLGYIKATRKAFIDEMNRKHNGFKMDFFKQFNDGSNSRECFIAYMESYIKRRKDVDMKARTYTSQNNKIQHLKNFRKIIHFEDFNIHLIEELNNYLKNKCGYKPNTIHNHHKIYKQYVRRAIRDKYIKHEENPYLEYKTNWKQLKVEYLKPSEVQKIEKYEPDNETMAKVKECFLFSCYTGLAYADYSNISFEDVKQSDNGKYYIEMKRQKTSKMIRLPISELFQMQGEKSKAENLLVKYLNKFKGAESRPKKDRLFFKMSNQKLNDNLKILAKKCKINKHLTTHYGRHTFGTILCNDLKIPITVVKELMTHSSIVQTAKYVIVNEEVVTKILNTTNWEEVA
jgi:site-specific recombinase XerD